MASGVQVRGCAYFNLDGRSKNKYYDQMLISTADKEAIATLPIWVSHGDDPKFGRTVVGKIDSVHILQASIGIDATIFKEFENLVLKDGYQSFSIGYKNTQHEVNGKVTKVSNLLREISICKIPNLEECSFSVIKQFSEDFLNSNQISSEVELAFRMSTTETKPEKASEPINETEPTTYKAIDFSVASNDETKSNIKSMSAELKEKLLFDILTARRDEISEKKKEEEAKKKAEEEQKEKEKKAEEERKEKEKKAEEEKRIKDLAEKSFKYKSLNKEHDLGYDDMEIEDCVKDPSKEKIFLKSVAKVSHMKQESVNLKRKLEAEESPQKMIPMEMVSKHTLKQLGYTVGVSEKDLMSKKETVKEIEVKNSKDSFAPTDEMMEYFQKNRGFMTSCKDSQTEMFEKDNQVRKDLGRKQLIATDK